MKHLIEEFVKCKDWNSVKIILSEGNWADDLFDQEFNSINKEVKKIKYSDDKINQMKLCIDELESLCRKQTNIVSERYDLIDMVYIPEGIKAENIKGSAMSKGRYILFILTLCYNYIGNRAKCEEAFDRLTKYHLYYLYPENFFQEIGRKFTIKMAIPFNIILNPVGSVISFFKNFPYKSNKYFIHEEDAEKLAQLVQLTGKKIPPFSLGI